MRTIFAVAALAVAFAAPRLSAQDFEIRPLTTQEFNAAQQAAHGAGEVAPEIEWRILVARANADRLAAENGTDSGFAGVRTQDATGSSGSGYEGLQRGMGTSPQ